MRRILIFFILLTTTQLYAEEYETATRLNSGDVISADVFNDILDRIEISLKSVESSDLVGTWEVTQTTCNLGVDCWSFATTGFGDLKDDLIITRTDIVTFSDDGDGTYSYSTGSFCPFWIAQGTYAGQGGAACTGRYIVGGGIIVFDGVPQGNGGYSLTKLSQTRLIMNGFFRTSSDSFNSIRIDKLNLAPDAPLLNSSLLSDEKVTLSWTAGDATQTGYDIHRKNTSTGSFSSIGTATSESYIDSSIQYNNSYWYRIFATNANGASVGSNVLRVNTTNTPPQFNLSSTISIYENTSAVVSVGASDVEGDTLTYSLSSQAPSSDASNMSISSDGILAFNSARDYENPGDYDSNNIYDITVSVSDGTDTVSQDLGIVVLDVLE